MPATGNKGVVTPFKTMDIKSALLSGGSRKRKSSSSQVCKPDVKKPSLDDDDTEILDEVCGMTIALDPSALENKSGKENEDVNAKNISVETSLSADCKENKDLNVSIDEPAVDTTEPSPKLTSSFSPKPVLNNSDDDLQPLSDKSKNSDNSSSDELNTSMNVSLNTSGLSATADDVKVTSANSKKSDECKDDDSKAAQTKEKIKKKKMTLAEAKQRAELREKTQKERLLKKQELENKKKERLVEKERRLKEKLLKKEREELERKERERLKLEKKEQEEKEKQEKEKERLLKQKEKEEKLQQKMEEKKRKEEMKQKREEELKKAEEEKLKLKLEKEQKEREKAERAKAAFVKFFVKGNTPTSVPAAQITEKEGAFLPFQVSDDMILAPVVPPAAQERFDKKQLDHYLVFQDGKELYLHILRSGSYKDVRHRKKNRNKVSEADVIVINKNAKAELWLSAKLLQFSENVRPPYWGTWRKKCKNISPRNPFGQDKEIFDYSVDSDDEWDEGGPGESLSGTEQEDEDENEDDYEVDNEFFVPHGYLSDEEEKNEDDDEEVNDPEKQKALLKIKLQEFELERKRKTTVLKPIILGCFFANNPAFRDSGIQNILLTFSAEILSENPIPTRFTIQQHSANSAESPKSTSSGNVPKKKHMLVPDKALPDLIRLVHGNIRNQRLLAEEFQKLFTEQYSEPSETNESVDQASSMEVDPSKDIPVEPSADSTQLSLIQVQRTIKSIATYGKPPEATINKCCWWVHDNIREKYGLMDNPLPCHKDYVIQKVEEKQLPTAKGTSIKEFLAQN